MASSERCNCRKPKCAACFADRNLARLQEMYPWLESATSTFGVGCKVCKEFFAQQPDLPACHGGSWRSTTVTSYGSIQPRALQKHEESDLHQRAVQSKGHGYLEHQVPSLAQFKALLHHARKNTIGESGIADIGTNIFNEKYVVDIGNSEAFGVNCTSNMVPTITELHANLFYATHLQDVLRPSEILACQGFSQSDLQPALAAGASESKLARMAGDAFTVTVFKRLLQSLLQAVGAAV